MALDGKAIRKVTFTQRPGDIHMAVHTIELLTDSEETELSHGRRAIIAVYDTHHDASEAIRDLQKSGVDMTKLSVIGKDYHTEENVVGYYTLGERMKSWGAMGAFWGGVWGLLFGSAFFMIPGIGPLLAAGPVVGYIIAALEGAALVGGLSALGAALLSIGIPNDSIIEYEVQIKGGKYLLIAQGSQDELAKIKNAFINTRHRGIEDYVS